MSKGNKVLILGADGFIGSHIASSLVDEGYFVRAFDLFRDGTSRNLGPFSDSLEMFSGDFLNRTDLKRSLQDIDSVFHFVSLTTPGSSMNDPLIDIETNLKGSVIFFDECVQAGVKKVVFASSGGGIYGNQGKEKYSEEDRAEPVSPYAISKLAIERYLHYYRTHCGLDSVILRYSNPYGPSQNVVGTQGLIPIFMNRMKNGSAIEIFGDGGNVRDYIYIDDLVAATKMIFGSDNRDVVYNVGSGEGTDINQVVSIIEKVTGMEAKKNYLPKRDIDVRSVVLDIGRMRSEFGDIRLQSLESGIRKTWDWIRDAKG
jgi:UDP-glucose 4-epimerase